MPTLTQLATSFARAHKAEGKSPHSIKLYRDCIRRLIVFAGEVLALVTRRTLTAFYAVRSETVAPATVWTDWKVHRASFQPSRANKKRPRPNGSGRST